MSVRALADAVRRYTDARGGAGAFATAVDGLTLHRADHERRPAYRVFKPTLCVVAQGAKRAIVGARRLEYRAGQALVASVEVPGAGWVAEASPSEPYLGVIVEFDLATMREVLEGLTSPPGANDDVRDEARDDARAGVVVVNVDGPLADCVLRLVRLVDTPAAIPTLRPLITRELCYWLLTGPRGGGGSPGWRWRPRTPSPSCGRCTCSAPASRSRCGSRSWRGSRRSARPRSTGSSGP